MKMIIMQCDCGENLTLAMNTKHRKVMGWCLKCGTIYDFGAPDVGEVELAEMVQKVHRIADQAKDAKDPEGMLFYLRCTATQLDTTR